MRKFRACDNPEPEAGGIECEGESVMVSTCNDTTCNGNKRDIL